MCKHVLFMQRFVARFVSGYGLAIIFEPALCVNMCYLCKDSWHDLLVYLSLNFILLTLFYMLILVFQVMLTSAPMTCFIMYSQLVVLALYEECHLVAIY